MGMGSITHPVVFKSSIIAWAVDDVSIPTASYHVLEWQWDLDYQLGHILFSSRNNV